MIRKAIIFGCITLFIKYSEAQPVTFLKVYTNYPDFHTIFSVVEDYEGGYITALHGDNGILIKTDSVGNEILVDTFLCGYNIVSIRNSNDSNFVFACTSNSSCTISTTDRDFKVCKINSNLDTLWTRLFSAPSSESTAGIRPLKDSSYIVYGDGDGSNNFYKIDSTGNVIWQHWVSMSFITSIIQDAENNFVLTGYVDGVPDSWSVVKTDSSGSNILWAKYYGVGGGGLSEMFHDLVQLPDSNYLVCGQSPEFIMKINKNTGDSIWNNNIPSVIKSIDKTNYGNYIAAGDYRLRLLNDTGGIVWTKAFSSSSFSFNWVRSTIDNGFIVAGLYNDGTQLYPMLLKTDSLGNFTTDMGELNIKVLHYSLYPNPLIAQSKLEFGNAKHERFEFALYDIMGRQIESSATTGDNFIINKGSKSPGLYLFKLVNTGTGDITNGKIVIK